MTPNPVPVLHIITRLIVGGAQENTMYTAALLDKSLFQVEVISGPQTGSEGSLIEEVRGHGISLTILPDMLRQVNPLHDLRALFQIARRLRAGNFTIVHTHSSKAGILGRLAARMAGVPIIVHTIHGWSFHNHMSPLARWTYIVLERWCASFTDALIVVAQPDIQKGLQASIGRPEQYHMIRSAIPLEDFNPSQHDRKTIRQELGLPPNVPVLGNVGRFSEQKNPLEWVRVAGRVGRQLPECRFLLVGDGSLRPHVEAKLKGEGLGERTIITGLRRDVPRLLSAMDVFLLTSLWEGLPRVIPQSLAMGIPVVAGRAGGIIDVITDGQNGYLCDPGDLDGLTSRCLELLKNPALRATMGERGRELAVREFDIKKMVEEITELYNELLQQTAERI
jgi:glycosyltransferase involved in cell wall biosynthesis